MKTNADAATQKATLTTTGDIYYASAANTPARLGIGSSSQVLTVSGGLPTWATPASGGGMTLLSTTSASGSSVTVSSINQTYKDLVIITRGLSVGSNPTVSLRLLNSATQYTAGVRGINNAATNSTVSFTDYLYLNSGSDFGSSTNNTSAVLIKNYADTSYYKPLFFATFWTNSSSQQNGMSTGGANTSNSAISSFVLFQNGGGSFSGGQILVYGVN